MDSLSINLSPRALVSALSSAQQQLVEIAKAFSRDAKIIIMDEPTASITVEDAENLFGIIRKITRTGHLRSSTSPTASRRSSRSPIGSWSCGTARRSPWTA